MVRVFREGEKTEELKSKELDSEDISAIDSDVRRRIIELISENPTFPSEIARELEIGKQRAYYHFRKLEKAGIIEKIGEKTFSGGRAQLFDSKFDVLTLDLGTKGESIFLPPKNTSLENFLHPLVEDGEMNGSIVVGSSERHGEDQVRAQDGHLSAEIAAKLGNHGKSSGSIVSLDTRLKMMNGFDQNLLILGGILTNTVAKKYNGIFPVKFSGESFPYREIETPENTYEGDRIGFISKTSHPEYDDKSIFIVAGVRRDGTRAAVKAFKQLEDLVEDYESGDFYVVVEGIDRSGDGQIDSFEVCESGF